MSFTIPDGSPWKAHALKFGAELRRAAETRNVGWRQLNAAIGRDVHTSFDKYKQGRNLPRLAQAAEFAEALAWPQLLEIVREARTFVCPVDGRTFICDTGARATYCSVRCRDRAATERARLAALGEQEAKAYRSGDPERVLVSRLKQELDAAKFEKRPVHVRELRDAIRWWEGSSSQSRHRRTVNRLNEHLAAVERFCRECEPEGICRNGECPLRAVSPLPFKPMHSVELAEQKRAHGGWDDPEIAERRRERQREVNAERWSRPGEREKASERKRAWHESLTPAERAAWIRKVSDRRRGHATYRACGCPTRKHYPDCPTQVEDAA